MAFINTTTPYNSLIHIFRTLSTHLIPSKPMRSSICIVLILILSFSFHIIASLPYIRTGISYVYWKTLAHSSYRPLALTRDIIATAILLLLATSLRHCLICNWFRWYTPRVFEFQPMLQLLPIHNHSNPSSPFSTITLLLPALNFRPLLHISTKMFHH